MRSECIVECGNREMRLIDWTQGSRRVFNFIRALSIPGPQATSWIDGKKITINKARMVAGAHAYVNIPGQVLGKTDDGFLC